jgi:hypothetical protein
VKPEKAKNPWIVALGVSVLLALLVRPFCYEDLRVRGRKVTLKDAGVSIASTPTKGIVRVRVGEREELISRKELTNSGLYSEAINRIIASMEPMTISRFRVRKFFYIWAPLSVISSIVVFASFLPKQGYLVGKRLPPKN